MSVTEKIWGTTECVERSALFEAHRLSIKPLHRCSLHRHSFKWNAFIVIKGTLYIDELKSDKPQVDTTTLKAGDFIALKPGEHHQFRTGNEPCEAYEVYYPEALSEDIERKDQGGPVEAN